MRLLLTGVAMILVVVMRVVVVKFVVLMGLRRRQRLCRNHETPARQRSIVVWHDAADGTRPKIETPDGGLDGGPVIRQGVQHRGHEHVARPAPQGSR